MASLLAGDEPFVAEATPSSTSADDTIALFPKRKRRRRETSLVEKINLIQRADSGVSQRHLARDFDIGLGTVNNILKKKAKTLYEAEAPPTNAPKRKARHEVVNSMVWDWYKAQKGPISGIMVQEKALELAKRVPQAQSFKASNGWLETFCKRHHISFRKQRHAATTAPPLPMAMDLPDPSLEEWGDWYASERMMELLKLYAPDDVFSGSETQLLYQTLPDTAGRLLRDLKDHSLSLQEDADVITLLLCCNATGSHKIPPLIVGSEVKVDASLEALGMKKAPQAWMTADIFHDWLLSLDADMKVCNRKILLLLPSTPCHSSDVDLAHVTVRVCPSAAFGPQGGCPLLHGIIQTFKDTYRVRLLRHVLAQRKLQVAASVDGPRVLTWVADAWASVAPSTCVASFARHPIGPSDDLAALLALYYAVIVPIVEPSLVLGPLEFIAVDDHLPTQLMFTEEWSLLEQKKPPPPPKSKLNMALAYELLEDLRAFAAEKAPSLIESLGHVSMVMEDKLVHEMQLHAASTMAALQPDATPAPTLPPDDAPAAPASYPWE